MPIMDVRYPAGRLDAAGRQALAERLTAVMVAMEGGADTEGGRAFATVLFTEVPAGFWWVGGRSDATHVSPSGAFLVHVSIPEGYMDQPTKGGVQADVTAAILATIGVAPGDGHSVQVILDEVGEGDWAAGGRTISIASIADTVGLAKSGDRFAWVRAYFTAKARTFAAAGYPKGTGGLLPDSASDRAGQAPNGAA
ncbi:MAG: tautomerase family protein [Amaricoccus sp.]|uniref:tautomerase family protein n=1 Tax=Amaricoccus sp. TaxID=1872485 RepID=UPI003314F28A